MRAADSLPELDLCSLVENAAEEDLPMIAGRLAEAQTALQVRVARFTKTSEQPEPDAEMLPHRHLTASELADRLSVSDKWVYAHQDELGAIKLDGCIRFPAKALLRYLRGHAVA